MVKVLQRCLTDTGAVLARLFNVNSKEAMRNFIMTMQDIPEFELKDLQTKNARIMYASVKPYLLSQPIFKARQVEIGTMCDFITYLIDTDLAYGEAFIEAIRVFLEGEPEKIEVRPRWWKK